MSVLIRALAALASPALAVGLVLCYARPGSGAAVTVAAGSLLALLAALVHTVHQTRPGGLVVQAGIRLPAPAWWAPVGAVGLVQLTATALVGRQAGWYGTTLAVTGVLLVALALVRLGHRLQATPEPGQPDRAVVRAAREVRAFGLAHPAAERTGVDVVLEHVARGATRLVLIAPDGSYGDQVLPDPDQAAAAAALAGANVRDGFDSELVGRVRTGRYEWRRMAGSQLGG